MKRLIPVITFVLFVFIYFTSFALSSGERLIAAKKIDDNKNITKLLSKKSKLNPEDFINTYQPNREFSRICLQIYNYLYRAHYKKMNFDDNLSEKVFKEYLSSLDSLKFYFHQSDIDDFQAYKLLFDNQIKTGNLDAAFIIFNKYHRRFIERIVTVVNNIPKYVDTFNYKKNETIESDRAKINWAKNSDELDILWKKRIKNDILNFLLDGLKKKEIKKLLVKRYKNQLKRAYQMTSRDVFSTFMNSVTQIFDPYSQYFPPRDSENFSIRMKQSLEGIGAMLQTENEYTKIVRLVPAGPAEKSKQLKPGDKIIGVGQGDGPIVDVIGWRIDDVVQLIRGPKKTVVKLKILSGNNREESKIVSITREKVKLEDQSAKKKLVEITRDGIKYKIGVISLPTFYLDFEAFFKRQENYKSTTRDVRKLIRELKKEKVNGIIIDLRNNGGGALQEAKDLTGLFIKTGPVVQVKQREVRKKVEWDGNPEVVYHGPLVVLVNRLSASASEIFAGAIQDYKRGIIIGTRTYGKGTVQSLQKLQQGRLKITLAKFYRISGESTQHKGVIPDINFPAIYDPEKIGESSYSQALKWDKIKPAFYHPFKDKADIYKRLSILHAKRIIKNPDFNHFVESNRFKKEMRNRTLISLNILKRKKERTDIEKFRLELENKRRKLKGMKSIKKLDELTQNDSEKDPFLVESENILIDYINQTSNN